MVGGCAWLRGGILFRICIAHIFFSVDCLYTPTPHLHHNFEAKVIPPGHAEDVTFTFYPREAIKYKEVITFEINGLSKQSIEIHGQGTEMRVSNARKYPTNMSAPLVCK